MYLCSSHKQWLVWANLPIIAGLFAIYLAFSTIDNASVSNYFNAGNQALYRGDIVMLIILNLIISMAITYLFHNFIY